MPRRPCYSATPLRAGWPGAMPLSLGPHRVKITLEVDSNPSSTIDAAANTKKSAAGAWRCDIHQPPTAMSKSRALCASTGPSTLAAPCEEK